MRININEIQEGCILSEDVFNKTNRPIIPKKTVLTDLHISVLKAFMVEEIEIENTLVNGIPIDLNEMEDQEVNGSTRKLGFSDLFLKAAYQLKKEFYSWQAGLPIDISKIRAILLPLLDEMEKSPHEVMNLHRYSTKETYIYQHSIAVSLISGFIGKKMNLEKGEWIQIAIAGCLADSGMAKINPDILSKDSSLTYEEYREVKKHPVYSYKMVREIPILKKEVKIAILEHHERLDGSGYPLGEKEKGIHLYARIIAIADIFHAMTSERPYRSKQSPYKVLEMMDKDSFGKFDIRILNLFTSAFIDYTTGDKVRLSDGRVAEILFVDEKIPTRPLIRLIDTGDIMELTKNRNVFIENILPGK